MLSGARTIGPSPTTGFTDDPLAVLNVLRWAAGLEPLPSDDVDGPGRRGSVLASPFPAPNGY